MLVRSSMICPFVSALSEETHEKNSLNYDGGCSGGGGGTDSLLNYGSNGGQCTDNETADRSICTDTIPLLCASNPSIIQSTVASTGCTILTPNGSLPAPGRKFSTGSDQLQTVDQQTLNFISSNNLKNTWESSQEIGHHQHVKAIDCISTISN